ncbi:MAG: hypothetical protein RIG66_09420 [Coleofasciculus sp. E2-BRE-01]
MPYEPQKHHRHSIRLKGYDYRQTGAYFVTLNGLILGDGSCRFLFELAIPNTGRPDNIDRLVLLFFAAGRPYNSINGDEIDGI